MAKTLNIRIRRHPDYLMPTRDDGTAAVFAVCAEVEIIGGSSYNPHGDDPLESHAVRIWLEEDLPGGTVREVRDIVGTEAERVEESQAFCDAVGEALADSECEEPDYDIPGET